LLCAAFDATTAAAVELHLRAREHYEDIRLHADGHASYFGFTNTINAWYEEPYRYSVGFAGSPLLARLRTGHATDGFADEIRLVHLGLEAKAFPTSSLGHTFIRVGLYQTTLKAVGDAGKLSGSSVLGGAGYEFDLNGIGVAPEMSWRQGRLQDDVRFEGTAPAIGVHFYKLI
jgi:hypothetical protein